MIHARDDYNRIQDPAGLIPDDEPVFLLRAQDKYAITALRAYKEAICQDTDVDEELLKGVQDHIKAMVKWDTKKTPDLPKLKLWQVVSRSGLCYDWIAAETAQDAVQISSEDGRLLDDDLHSSRFLVTELPYNAAMEIPCMDEDGDEIPLWCLFIETKEPGIINYVEL